MKKKAACLLALTHLTLVAVTICHGTDRWLHRGWWEKPLMLYSSLSYAMWRFGFFSPNVGKSTEVEIKVYGADGPARRYSTLEGFRFFVSNIESANRFYVFKRETARADSLQDLCARSVATRMLNEQADASRVDFAMRSILYPPMREYASGAPVRTVEYYSTTFLLHGHPERPEPPAEVAMDHP